MVMDLMGLAWGNLWRARLRLFMTAAGVVVGTMAVILLIALTFGLQRVAESGIGSNDLLTKISVYPPELSSTSGEGLRLNNEALASISALDGVETALPLLSFRGRAELRSGKLRSYPAIFGLPLESLADLNIPLRTGDFNSEGVIYGVNVPDYFFNPDAEDTSSQTVDVFTERVVLAISRFDESEQRYPLEARAILAPYDERFDNALLVPLEVLLDYQAWANDAELDESTLQYDEILIRTTSREVTLALEEQIRAWGFKTVSVGDILTDLNRFFVTMRIALGATGGIALLVAAFVVANTMMMSVLERIHEIGVLKAIGARDSNILWIFLFEAAFVGFSGGFVGIIFATLLAEEVNRLLLSQADSITSLGFLPLNPSLMQGDLLLIPMSLNLFALALATGVGILAGLLPALRAARMSPVTALKL